MATTKKPTPKMSENRRIELNRQRLQELNPKFCPKVAAVLRDLESSGERPYIACGYRSLADQAKAKAGGFSTVGFSYHNCRDPKTGKPDALAADIICADRMWDAPPSFWMKLASSAEAHGLESGSFWGVPDAGDSRIRALIRAKLWNAAVKLGWDKPHIQWKGISLARAKAGVRP